MNSWHWKPWKAMASLLLAVVGISAIVGWMNVRGEDPINENHVSEKPLEQVVSRGAYLSRAGNCAACHTARGGVAFAGGRAIETPFGIVYSSNLTPDPETGIGRWNQAHFWRAMHHGRSRDGRLLYPAFPYADYTHITREDSDALYAFLRSLPPVSKANLTHDLRFPYNSQVSLAVWRALFFSPASFKEDASRSTEWNRGAYLVRGLGHCQACHAPRNIFGATTEAANLSGGLIPMQNWYAPSLRSKVEAGVQDWSAEETISLLRDGRTSHATALGPMADVVYGSTQSLSETDLRAMATFLRDLPREEPQKPRPEFVPVGVRTLGARIYKAQCAECHGDEGEGGGNLYLSLAGQRTVTMQSSANLVKIIINGGFAPTTAGNPRPFGMPPFGQNLSNAEIAAVASFVRSAWGNNAGPVSELDVFKVR